jgi:hypothetical protein
MNFSQIKLPSNRKFGFFFTAIFFTATSYSYYIDSQVWVYIFGTICLIFLIVTIVKSDSLLHLNKLWMRFGIFLGMITSPIVMGIIFFGIFTPIAILMRLFGRDELRLMFENKKSYWIDREPNKGLDHFKNQY